MKKVHTERIDRFLEAMQERSVEHLWIEPSVGFRYLTGIEALSFERLAGLLVSADGELRLLVPLLLREEFDALADRAEQFVWDDGEGPTAATIKALTGVDSIYVQRTLPVWAFEALRSAAGRLDLTIDPGLLSDLREKKDADELDLLRASSRVTDEVVEWIGTLDFSGVTERQLAGRIRARYLELGYEPAEWALVASGTNASMPHYAGGDVSISSSAPLLTDFGGTVGGYWSDITRVHFPRSVDPEITEAYEVVCSAAAAAFDAATAGTRCMDVDRAARSVIEDAGYGEYFVHRTGHGVGLEVHESPYITSTNEQVLEPGHVFTIEPGVYLPGKWGLRYENVVHVGPHGPESLNKSPRINYLK